MYQGGGGLLFIHIKNKVLGGVSNKVIFLKNKFIRALLISNIQ